MRESLLIRLRATLEHPHRKRHEIGCHCVATIGWIPVHVAIHDRVWPELAGCHNAERINDATMVRVLGHFQRVRIGVIFDVEPVSSGGHDHKATPRFVRCDMDPRVVRGCDLAFCVTESPRSAASMNWVQQSSSDDAGCEGSVEGSLRRQFGRNVNELDAIARRGKTDQAVRVAGFERENYSRLGDNFEAVLPERRYLVAVEIADTTKRPWLNVSERSVSPVRANSSCGGAVLRLWPEVAASSGQTGSIDPPERSSSPDRDAAGANRHGHEMRAEHLRQQRRSRPCRPATMPGRRCPRCFESSHREQ